MRVTFAAPNIGSAGDFYEIFADLLQVATRQLGIDFDVIDGGKDVQTLVKRCREAVTGARRPDYMLLVNNQGTGRKLLASNAAAGVGTFFVVEGIADVDVGTGGGHLPTGCVGQIVPDDAEAGHMLAQILVDAARKRGLVDGTGKVLMATIAGEHTQAGTARFLGLQTLMKQRSDVVAAGFDYGFWEEQQAKQAVALLLRSSPKIHALWCANDAMALGALAAAVEAGRQPGKDILIGGIDLIDRALTEVAAGRLEVSIGGHLVDGVRALLLLHDHHEKNMTPQRRTTHLVAVQGAQANHYLKFMRERAWRQVDFTRFSRRENPDAAESRLSMESILAHLD